MLRTYRRFGKRTTRFDLSSMCRMCLAQNLSGDKLVDIFVEEPVTNVSVIEFCTGIECEENDGLPPKICYDCYNILTTFFAFKKMCHASDKYCKAFRDAPTITADPADIIENDDLRVEVKDELSLAENNDMGLLETDCIDPGAPDEVLLQIKKCEENYETAHPKGNIVPFIGSAIQSSLWEEEVDDEELMEEEEFLHRSLRQQHQHKQFRFDSAAVDEPQAAKGREAMIGCDVSDVEPSQPDRPAPVDTSVRRHSARPSQEVLERTIQAAPVKQPYRPEGADTSRSPIIIRVEGKKYHCVLCSKPFLSQNSLKRHIKNHGNAQYKCPQCEKAFHQQSSMKRHLQLHSDRRFVCSSCSKVLLSREGLKCHIRTQHTERSGSNYFKYNCTNCPKTFAHSSGLSRHMAIHRGITYECEHCSKKFNDSSQLKRHRLKNHQGADSDSSKDVRSSGSLQPQPSELAPSTVA